MQVTEFGLNDIVQMKKQHPCGSHLWRVIRVGADIKIKCEKCARIVMMDRTEFVKRVKKVVFRSEKIEVGAEGES